MTASTTKSDIETLYRVCVTMNGTDRFVPAFTFFALMKCGGGELAAQIKLMLRDFLLDLSDDGCVEFLLTSVQRVIALRWWDKVQLCFEYSSDHPLSRFFAAIRDAKLEEVRFPINA